jgi:hypothetical protein
MRSVGEWAEHKNKNIGCKEHHKPMLHEGEEEKESSKDEAKRTHLERDNQCPKQRQNPYPTGWIRGQVARSLDQREVVLHQTIAGTSPHCCSSLAGNTSLTHCPTQIQ